MVQSRFPIYYENHSESYDISEILKTSNDKLKSAIKPEPPSKTDASFEKKQRSDGYAYLEKSIEMKIELAFMYLNRSRLYLESIGNY